MKSTAKKVLMVGTEACGKGGIASVIDMYSQNGLLHRIDYMVSHNDQPKNGKLKLYLSFLPRYFFHLLRHPELKIVHVHTASYASFIRKSIVILIARSMGRKVILHVHGAEFNKFYDIQKKPIKSLIRFVLRRCNILIALSNQWKKDLYRISGNPNIRVIYNPAVIKQPVSSNGRSTVEFLFMGRIGKRKGVYDLLHALRSIKNNHIQIRLYGDGEVETVEKLVQQYNLSEKVAVCGWVDGEQKEHAFQNAHVLILPSYNEGLPISVLEAMAYGMPVLSTSVGGIPDAVTDGLNGFLVQPGDQEMLTRRIEELADSPDLRKRMGQAGYEIAMQKFSLPVIVQQLEDLYQELSQD